MGSDFLITTPGFLSGVARLVDLWGVLDDFNFAPNPEMADAIAMSVDWQCVGQDLRNATEEYRHQASPQLSLFDENQRVAASG